MEEKSPTRFIEWMNSLTISDAVNVILILLVTITVLILVVRTFRNKSSV
ncbi:MAG: hypothetical protein AB8B73_10225 [Ekhidna sp.]